MKGFDRKTVWWGIRNSLLIVAVIHILVFLRVFESAQITGAVLWRALRFRLVGWTAWSLIAPGIWLLARFYSTRRLKLFQAIGGFVCGGFFFMALYYVLEETFKVIYLGLPFFESFVETRKNLLWGWDFPIFALIFGFSLALEYYRNNRLKEAQASRMEKELAVNTLAALKTQVQPHFLFNTLHVISTLVKKDPETAEKMIARLSDLLRSTMKGADVQEVTLTAELDTLMNYIEIVQMRFKDRLKFSLDALPETAEALVPALFLQTLVENSVRHGIAQNYEGGEILVKAHRERKALIVEITDTGPGFAGTREEILGRGSGLANLQKRLNLLYPGDFRLELNKGERGGARVVLEIPFRTRPAAPE